MISEVEEQGEKIEQMVKKKKQNGYEKIYVKIGLWVLKGEEEKLEKERTEKL